jgi:hypothetical protein
MSYSSDGERFRPFLFEYQHDGGTWGIEILARDHNDAWARIRAMAAAQLKGPVLFSVPATLGPLTRLLVRIRNALRTDSR